MFFKTIDKVHEKSGKNKVCTFFDMVYSGLRFGAGYVDYYQFQMYNMNNKEKAKDEEYTYLNDSITVTPPDYSDLSKNYVAYNGDKKYSYNYSNYLPVESYQQYYYSLKLHFCLVFLC